MRTLDDVRSDMAFVFNAERKGIITTEEGNDKLDELIEEYNKIKYHTNETNENKTKRK